MSKTKNTKNVFTAITNKLGNTALIKKVPGLAKYRLAQMLKFSTKACGGILKTN